MKVGMLIGGLFVIAVPILAQVYSPPALDVASVRITPVGDTTKPERRGGPGTKDPGRLILTHTTLGPILRDLYGLQVDQVVGPAFLTTETYDIHAVIPPNTTKQQAVEM